jgi:polyferredoxin
MVANAQPSPRATAVASTTSPGKSFLSRFFRKKRRPGSGIPARRVIVGLLWGRRLSQAGFFGLFLYLLTQTAFRGSFAASSDAPVRLPWPVEGFLLTDPFVALLTLFSTHTIYAGLAWSLSVVFLTLLVGRAFCGWICPFGTLHHFTAWLFPSRKLKGAARVESNRTKGWQLYKY